MCANFFVAASRSSVCLKSPCKYSSNFDCGSAMAAVPSTFVKCVIANSKSVWRYCSNQNVGRAVGACCDAISAACLVCIIWVCAELCESSMFRRRRRISGWSRCASWTSPIAFRMELIFVLSSLIEVVFSFARTGARLMHSVIPCPGILHHRHTVAYGSLMSFGGSNTGALVLSHADVERSEHPWRRHHLCPVLVGPLSFNRGLRDT